MDYSHLKILLIFSCLKTFETLIMWSYYSPFAYFCLSNSFDIKWYCSIITFLNVSKESHSTIFKDILAENVVQSWQSEAKLV